MSEQIIALQRTIAAFIKDYENPCHEYMKVMPAVRVNGSEYLVYMLMHSAHKINNKMAEDAIYLFEIDIKGTNWPGGPPKGRVLTPNGMFSKSANICTSNGVYHPDQYVSIPLPEHIFSMYMAMVTNDKMLAHGIGVTDYGPERGPGIITASKFSKNVTLRTYGKVVDAIEEFYQEYSGKWPKMPGDPAKYVPGVDGHYIELPSQLTADHATRCIHVFGQPDTWPTVHPRWRTAVLEIDGIDVPSQFVVIKKTIDDELDNLGL